MNVLHNIAQEVLQQDYCHISQRQHEISQYILHIITTNHTNSHIENLHPEDASKDNPSKDNLRPLVPRQEITKEIKKISNVLSKIYTEIHQQGTSANELNTLTKQEVRIFQLIAKGNQTKEIAAQLFISSHTVNVHRKNIYRKLKINSIAQLVKLSLIYDLS